MSIDPEAKRLEGHEAATEVLGEMLYAEFAEAGVLSMEGADDLIGITLRTAPYWANGDDDRVITEDQIGTTTVLFTQDGLRTLLMALVSGELSV